MLHFFYKHNDVSKFGHARNFFWLTWLILFSYESWWIVGYPKARGDDKNNQKDKDNEWK